MPAKKTNSTNQYLLGGVVVSASRTGVIRLAAANLPGFQITGNADIAFAYSWRLIEPNAFARLSAWAGYLLQNLIVNWIINLFCRPVTISDAATD